MMLPRKRWGILTERSASIRETEKVYFKDDTDSIIRRSACYPAAKISGFLVEESGCVHRANWVVLDNNGISKSTRRPCGTEANTRESTSEKNSSRHCEPGRASLPKTVTSAMFLLTTQMDIEVPGLFQGRFARSCWSRVCSVNPEVLICL